MNVATDSASELAPETLEGWYALHQIYSIDRRIASATLEARHRIGKGDVRSTQNDVTTTRNDAAVSENGWSAIVELIGSKADIMAIHFRPTLDGIGAAQREFERQPVAAALQPVYSFLSVTEAGLYHLSAELARGAAERGGAVGDAAYGEELSRRVSVERDNAHVQRRLYPQIPEGMRYVS